jgi:hypothetical protein
MLLLIIILVLELDLLVQVVIQHVSLAGMVVYSQGVLVVVHQQEVTMRLYNLIVDSMYRDARDEKRKKEHAHKHTQTDIHTETINITVEEYTYTYDRMLMSFCLLSFFHLYVYGLFTSNNHFFLLLQALLHLQVLR